MPSRRRTRVMHRVRFARVNSCSHIRSTRHPLRRSVRVTSRSRVLFPVSFLSQNARLFAGQKVWAIFEPRSNTTRRNVFQQELALSFADADAVIVSQVAKLEQLKAEERLNPEQLMKDIAASGKPTAYLADVDAIVEHIAKNVQGGDVVCVFSNGGFGNIHARLLDRLNGRR